jgi:hypothetical protein
VLHVLPISLSILPSWEWIQFITPGVPRHFWPRDHLLRGLALTNTHILNKIFLNGMRVKFSQQLHPNDF